MIGNDIYIRAQESILCFRVLAYVQTNGSSSLLKSAQLKSFHNIVLKHNNHLTDKGKPKQERRTANCF